MIDSLVLLWPYLLGGLVICSAYLWRRKRRDRHNLARQEQAVREGMNEPPTLHPVIDPTRCVGSGSCAIACPEKALGIVAGKAVLVHPAACIGHGACHAACAFDAIQLVFGTARRGIDIPDVSPDFQSNVPGIFIAGELGGMGLIRKAAEQGRQAMDAIARRPRGQHEVDVAVVGAGPAGLSAGLAALDMGLRYCVIEQEDSLGGAIYHYPRQKMTLAKTLDLARVGRIKAGDIRKEELLEVLQKAVEKAGLTVRFGEQLVSIRSLADGFELTTSRGKLTAGSVLLAIGRRGTPRRLGVDGEALPKVTYRLIDPEQYRGQDVLVVGGGDTAIEAAVSLEGAGARVHLSYRGAAFSRGKQRNREQLDAARARGLTVRLESQVLRITSDAVELRVAHGTERLKNDAVIICAGGELPTPMLKAMGIRFETKFGTA
jgi:thioredoxin reductase (NADPH)